MVRPPIPLKNPYLAAFLAWLVPGLGHVYQGRRGKGLLYFVCILGLFLAGLTMGGGKIVFWRWVSPFRNFEDFRLWYLAQFWVGLAAFPAVALAERLQRDQPGVELHAPDPEWILRRLVRAGDEPIDRHRDVQLQLGHAPKTARTPRSHRASSRLTGV